MGSLLVAHITKIILDKSLPPDQAVLITDGFRGRALKSFQIKGFTCLPIMNPQKYHVLKLDIEKSPHKPLVSAIKNVLSAGAETAPPLLANSLYSD
jgi:hypothetical protein